MGSKNKNKKNKNKVEAVSTGDGAEDSGGSHQNNGKGKKGKIITDARFASLHSDPRFTEAPKNKEKVSIDSRFNRMFTDKNFASSKARIDKRGKPKKKETAVESLKHYYRLEDDEDEERAKKIERIQKMLEVEESGSGIAKLEGEEDGSESSESEDSDSEGENEEDKRKKRNLKVKSESEESESEDVESDDDASASTTDSDEGDDELYEEDEGTLMQEENIPEIDKETHRLAVVNMDWSEVKAVDLYVLLSSFLPKEGYIKSVSVYPSEFGIKRMEEEAIHGPVGLFDEDKEKNDEDEDEDEDDDEIDNEKLRTYEISRLRYYYAVVECDSIATADYLYKTCDGVEFERSSTKLDLRFIPDSMEFKHQPRDVATEAPADYEGVDFHTRALQHSKIQLTWDDDEPQRAKTLKRKFNADQLADLELEEFLASDEGESSDSADAEAIRERSAKKQKKQDLYRSLLQSGDGSDENDQDEEENQDMEVTFNTGLEDLSKRILEKKDRNSESVWEAYLRKRREKRKNRKNRSKNSSEDESSDTDEAPIDEPDDFFVEESSAKGSKKSRGKTTRNENPDDEMAQETEASRAELELLLADDKETDTNLKGYNLKRKKLKGKKGKEPPDEEKLPAADYDDPRFAPLFSSPLFALDPTDPQFKRSAAYARQMAQKQQKGERGNVGAEEQSAPMADEAKRVDEGGSQPDGLTSKKEKHELSSLVKSIKMKSKQVLQQSKNPKGSKRK